MNDSLVTAGAAILGAIMIVFQLGRQHRNELNRQTENFKAKLRLDVYEEFSSRLAMATDAIGKAGMYAFAGSMHVSSRQRLNGFEQPIADRAQVFLELQSKAMDEVVEIIFLLEKYAILNLDLDIFRTALAAGSHELRKSFHKTFDFMVLHYPVDAGTTTAPVVENVKVLSDKQLQELKSLGREYHGCTLDLTCYLNDLRTELQILLLSYLFPNELPRRRPADPKQKVITLHPESVKSLRQHFLKNTEWGKQTVDTQLEVHRRFH